MILEPGTFRVKDFRKPIPEYVTIAALIRQGLRCAESGVSLTPEDARRIKRDHRPALVARPYDTDAGDFIPPQHDPKFIDILLPEGHRKRTTGQIGEKRVSGRGSDVTEASRTVNIRAKHERFKVRQAEKIGQVYTPPPHGEGRKQTPSRRIPSRKFNSKGKCPFNRQKRKAG